MMNVKTILIVLFLGTVCETEAVDNNPPEFQKFINGLEIKEDTQPGTTVFTLVGKDPEGLPLTYGVLGDVFQVGPNSGVVVLQRRLDFERNKDLKVIFTLSDGVNTIKPLATIHLKDVNDVKPSFTKSTYFREIPESFAVGGVVIKDISVVDNEGVNDLLSVKCEAGTIYADDCATFGVQVTGRLSSQSWNGQLILNKPLNYEKKRNYQVPLVAFDGRNKQTKSVEIRVLDVADLPPYFVKAISISIPEELSPGSPITTVSAVDGDKFSPRTLRYSIYNDTLGLFQINPDSGLISIVKRIDREDSLLALGYSDIYLKVQEVIKTTPFELGNSPSTTATTTIRVSILDINDNIPTFTQPRYISTIPENIATDRGVPNLLMTVIDKDAGTNANFVFEIEKYFDRFYIHPASGEGISTNAIRIKNSSLIDYEKGPKIYEFKVIARETNTTKKYSSSASCTIYVTDVNDNAPISQKPYYEAKINEDAPAGTPVTTIQAYDIDSGAFGTNGIRYTQLKGMHAELFTLNQISGEVTVAACATPGKYPCLNYEFRKQINLTVEIVDNNNAPTDVRRTLVDLIINVEDTNDNKPIFPNPSYYGKIAEGSMNPSPEVIVKAEDIDQVGSPVRYSLINEEVPGLFQIGLIDGKITATRPVKMSDSGTDSYITMDVIASDGVASARASVKIEVLDKNNNIPTFSRPDYKTCIPESFAGGKSVIATTATDGDKPGSSNAKISYLLEFGAEGQFTIDDNGIISSSFQARFDYEKKKKYTFRVVARDNGSPQLSSSVPVEICITDVNDNIPFFIPFTTQVNIKEDEPIGYSLVKLNGVDVDTNSNLQYAFVDPSSAINPNGVPVDKNFVDYRSWFSLNSGTGEIRVAKPMDRDKASLITQTINVIDLNGVTPQTGTGTLIISIQDVNQIPPKFAPPWTTTNPFYSVTLNEEQSIGSFVTILNAIDEDGSIEGYKLLDMDGYFNIKNGVVTVRKRIDYEQIESLKFVAYAWDNVEPKMTATATVNVAIKNINDNAPQFKNLYNPIINENSPVGTKVVTVTATDADKGDYGNIRYEIGAPDTAFRIDAITGEITVKNASFLDRERVKQIVLPITAYDSPLDSSVRLNTTVAVYIELRDENDNPPVFERKSYYETVVETIPIGSRIIDISARDKDIGQNALVTYAEGNGDSDDLFTVSSNGAIFVESSLKGKLGNHTFNVQANNPPYVDTATVTVNVLKGSSKPPIWTIPASDNIIVPVLESQYLGMYVYQVRAEDPDTGPSGLLTYSFLVDQRSAQTTGDFRINPVTGVIRAERVFDREEIDFYTLMLLVTDHSKNPIDVSRRLRIQVLDVNDNKPQFPTRNGTIIPYVFEVPENSKIGYHIGDVTAYDIDLNPTVYYQILSGNEGGEFELNQRTGALKLKKAIDRERVDSYTLNIEAVNNVTDYSVMRPRNRRNVDASVTKVKVIVSDMDDEKPTFLQKEYYGCISTGATVMTSILQIEAVDKDALGSSAINYYIENVKRVGVDQTAEKTFVIGDRDGIIRNTEIMSKYESDVFSMDGVARDKGGSVKVNVLVFVTQKSQTVKVVLTQQSADVYFFINQIKRLISNKTDDSYVCIADIKEHTLANGETSKYWSDLFVYIIDKKSMNVLGASAAAKLLNTAQAADEPTFSGLYVNKIQVAEFSEVKKERIPLLIIMILVILFCILAMFLACLACWCIARSKRKDLEKATLAKERMGMEAEKEHVYSNRAFQEDSAVFSAGDVVYSNRGQVIGHTEMVDSPLYSTINKSQQRMINIPDQDPPLGPEPVIEVPLDNPDIDDPAVYSVPEAEVVIPDTNPEPVPVIVSPLLDPEPVIETEPIEPSSFDSATPRSSVRDMSRRTSSVVQSVHSSHKSGELEVAAEPSIVTSPTEPESPTEALQQMEAVFAFDTPPPPPDISDQFNYNIQS